MKLKIKILIIALIVLLAGSIAGNIICYLVVYKTFDKFNDLRLDPLNENMTDKFVFGKNYYDTVILGDSLAENWHYDRPDVLNLGIGSQTSAQIKMRSGIYKNKLHGNKLIIFTGGNDIKCAGTNPGRKDRIVSDAVSNIEKTILNLKDNFNDTIVITVVPVFKLPIQYITLYSGEVKEAHKEINTGIKRVAEKINIKIIDSHELFDKLKKKEKLSDDGIHLNKNGYKFLEEEVEKL